MEKQDNFKHIVRVRNTDLDGNRKIGDSIRKIKGVGFTFAQCVCTVAGVDRSKRAGDLSDDEVKKLNDVIATAHTLFPKWLLNRRRSFESNEPVHLVTTDLTYAQENDIRLMQRIKNYKGVRHNQGAPVRGQRTRSNFRRNKGKVMGVAKKSGKGGGESPKKDSGKK
jgi:small subunit ribosomal protein S13